MLSAPASAAKLKLVTPPAAELFAYSDSAVLEFLKITADEAAAESTYIGLILAASRGLFERETGLALITQTWQAQWDEIPRLWGAGCRYSVRSLSLSRAPLIAITGSTYLDEDGASQTFDHAANLIAANVGVRDSYGIAQLLETGEWPDLGRYAGALRINFTAGFGAAASAVPEDCRLAVLQLAGHWYQFRLPMNAGNIVNALPLHLQRLLASNRIDG